MAKDNNKHWIGFDLGGTKMLAVVFNGKFEPVGRARKRTKGHEGMAAGLERINSVIKEAIEKADLKKDDIGGLGIGCPGPLNLKKKLIEEAPNLGWQKVPIGKSIENAFGFPVTVANDVDAGVFGEYTFGAGKGARCVVGIFPGTGIGGGCVYEGELIRGANCTCMEIGHIPIASDGPLDGAGNKGSLESLASRLAIAGQAAQACYRGQAPELLKEAGTNVGNIRSGALADSIANGDKTVKAIVEDAARYLATSVVTMVHLLAPDKIILGGGMIEAMGDVILPIVEKSARRRILPSLRDVFEVVEAKLGDDAGVMGAAALARHDVLEK